jgi:predicted porin
MGIKHTHPGDNSMKKTLLAVTLASLFPLAAVADVVVYGKANVSVQNADEAALDDSRLEVVSNASRIGVKGGEDVNSSLKVIYQFEYQTEVDDGRGSNNQTFAPRNMFLGLQGTGGTLMAGHFDTPTKVLQEKVDQFNDLEGDINTTRASNIVQYTTPSFGGGFAAAVAYVTEENDGTFVRPGETTDGVSASFAYTSPMFYAGVSVDRDIEMEGADLVRAVARLTLGSVQLGVLAEQYEVEDTDIDETGALVSALWNITDKWALKGQYGTSDVKIAGVESETASIGLDYKMTKNATLFSYATKVENALPRWTETTPPVITAGYRDDTYVGAGVDFKF